MDLLRRKKCAPAPAIAAVFTKFLRDMLFLDMRFDLRRAGNGDGSNSNERKSILCADRL